MASFPNLSAPFVSPVGQQDGLLVNPPSNGTQPLLPPLHDATAVAAQPAPRGSTSTPPTLPGEKSLFKSQKHLDIVEQAVNLYSTFAPYNYQGQRSIQAYRAWIAIYDGLFDHVEGTACGFSKWPKEKEGIAKLKKRVHFILDTLSDVYCHKLSTGGDPTAVEALAFDTNNERLNAEQGHRARVATTRQEEAELQSNLDNAERGMGLLTGQRGTSAPSLPFEMEPEHQPGLALLGCNPNSGKFVMSVILLLNMTNNS